MAWGPNEITESMCYPDTWDDADPNVEGSEGSGALIAKGDGIAYLQGPREDHDYGEVVSVDFPTVIVAWEVGACKVSYSVPEMKGMKPYISVEDARKVYMKAASSAGPDKEEQGRLLHETDDY